MLYARAAAVAGVLAVSAAASGPAVLASWPALVLLAYLAALAGCLAHRALAAGRPRRDAVAFRTGGAPAPGRR